MTAKSSKKANYWMAVPAAYGGTLAVVVITEWPWPLIAGAAFVLLLILQRFHGRAEHKAQAEPGTDSATLGLLSSTFGAAAILIHGSDIAVRAGPLLGLITFVTLHFWLARRGRIHQHASGNPELR
ncbi:hypothetical protein [Paenarthrobacter aromaticivorans]|uniref:Uncharacterized protein n=1 Tax=Paenarthrobacter aromaticivorans TaxID=2849150 RepID=A0ABS6IDH9_9MICC|nr:hypothetical protein [Paenarthrobacter sp. MMS21-TAE1-1]MBU8868429.1 hypothetical protein [Paenarthrobacter sp. MMS21-TAE1-1]